MNCNNESFLLIGNLLEILAYNYKATEFLKREDKDGYIEIYQTPKTPDYFIQDVEEALEDYLHDYLPGAVEYEVDGFSIYLVWDEKKFLAWAAGEE